MFYINHITIIGEGRESESLRTAAENWLNLKFAIDGWLNVAE